MPYGAAVNQSAGAPPEPFTQMIDTQATYEYVGTARSSQQPYSLTVSAVSTAAAASFTVTAHGLQSDNAVTISGATGDWAALNGTRVITVTGADAFTVAVNSSTFTGDFDGTVTSMAPRTNASIWWITKRYISGSNTTRTTHANGSVADNQAWDSRTSLAYQ